MGLFAEIAPHQQRLLQVADQITGGLGQAVLSLGSQVGAETRYGEEPGVEGHQVGDYQHHAEGHVATIGGRAPAATPTFAVQ